MNFKRALILIVILLAALGVIFLTRGFGNIFGRPPTKINTSRAAIIKEMRELGRLETASFTIEKVIEAGTEGNVYQEILFGDRLLLIAHGQVIAGFDISETSENSMKISGDTLELTLPAPQILITSLDNAKTRVYDRRQGFLSKGDKDLEANARQKAEESIRAAACESGILDEASKNARKQLRALFSVAGFTEIEINIPEGTCK